MNPDIRQLIKALRAHGLTAAEMGRRTGLSRRSIENWSQGRACRLFGAAERFRALVAKLEGRK